MGTAGLLGGSVSQLMLLLLVVLLLLLAASALRAWLIGHSEATSGHKGPAAGVLLLLVAVVRLHPAGMGTVVRAALAVAAA